MILGLIAGIVLSGSPLMAQQPASDPARIAQAPNATVGLVAGGAGSTDLRIAADIARVVEDGDKLRVLPMLGRGSIQNIADLMYLKGVDVAIVDADSLTQTIQRNAIGREGSIQYIAKLFEEEVHILAGRNITSLNDLNGKPVEIGPPGSGTELTATRLLDALRIRPSLEHDWLTLALDRLRKAEVAAMFVIGGKPVPALQGVESGAGLHFLPIPLNAQLVDSYLPTYLDHRHYPTLVPDGPPIDTVAVGSVMITLAAPADSLRAKRVNRFVDMLFERFDQFRQPGFHPKWQEVSLSAQIPGLTRYPQAQILLKKQDQANEARLRFSFEAFLSQSGQNMTGMNDERRQALFRDFLRWRDRHSGP